MKIGITVVGSYWVLLFLNNMGYSNHYRNELNLLRNKYEQLEVKNSSNEEENTKLLAMKDEFELYKEKMNPFEEEAQKIEDDKKVAHDINTKIKELPVVSELELSHKKNIDEINQLLKKASKEQKSFINIDEFSNYNKRFTELEQEKVKADKKREEEKIKEEKDKVERLKREKEQREKSLDFVYQYEYPTYGESMEFVDLLNEHKDVTQMTAIFYESSDGSKNGIKLISNSSDLTAVINETEINKTDISSYNELMNSIASATSGFDSRIQFLIVNPLTNNVITIIRDGVVIETLIK